MSDGTIHLEGDTLTSDTFGYAPIAGRASVAQSGLDMHSLAEWLPRLGTVLWLYREPTDSVFPRARLTSHGVLLLEHHALVALANCTDIHARSSVTTRGPREWLDVDAGNATVARLYLLPDTDCMAWDGMLEALGETECTPTTHERRWHAHRAFMRCAFGRARTSWQARIVRLPMLHLPCLQVLGLRDAPDVSSFGRQLGSAIAGDEAARIIVSESRDAGR